MTENDAEDFGPEPAFDACFVDPRSPGDLYLFKGDRVLLVDSGGNKRRWDKPQKISEWHSLYPFSSGIDACFVDPRSPGDLYLFKGNQVCLVDSGGNKRRWEDPQKIAEWRPKYPFQDKIDACFVSHRSPGDLYLFKDDEVAQVDSGGDKLRWGPTKIADWRPSYPFDSNIDACFVDLRSPGDLYLFKGKYVCLVDADGDKVRKGRQTIASWRSQYLF
ncbi:hypothetical protein GCM10010425_64410 [Streptomyces spororaveus]|uniref:Hemopexin n=1 Tax=Streptomyces spororaveus TaxID=284039 RepID=A0ABQ3T6T4_9ACTN|nr:hemopexin repeat-containing protein [Streptomyces spororaveus]GHI76113.1 hypothetical protein Sspor_16740 [Streptomyces spororaveus]